MTRCLARYFGGELSLRPLEGHGTDACLHLAGVGVARARRAPSLSRQTGSCRRFAVLMEDDHDQDKVMMVRDWRPEE